MLYIYICVCVLCSLTIFLVMIDTNDDEWWLYFEKWKRFKEMF